MSKALPKRVPASRKDLQSGLFVGFMGLVFALKEFDYKLEKVTRGKTTYMERNDVPEGRSYFTLVHPEVLDAATPEDAGIRNVEAVIATVTGKIGEAGCKIDYHPEVLGSTYFVVDGDIIPFTPVPGITGKEGSKNRHPKFSIPRNEALVLDVGARQMNASFLISQTKDNACFVSSGISNQPQRQGRTPVAPAKLASIGGLKGL